MKVIIDCDTGNDDAWAIIALLRAEHKLDYKVIALTCVNGNTTVDHSALNNLLLLTTADRMDIPVYKGAAESLIKKPVEIDTFHGVDGFGMVYKDKPSADLIKEKHAVFAIKEYIDENPNDITILALGPLTNIALLYKLFPGISSKITNLYIMGGNHQGVGNISKCAEFNFWCDPEAANIVLAESKCPIYIYPWEPCTEAAKATPFDDWRISVLAKNGNQFTNLLDPIEIKTYNNAYLKNWTPCDSYLASCFISPKLIKKMTSFHVTVELAGNNTRGQMIIDHRGRDALKPNVNVIQEIDSELFKKFMLWVCHHDDSGFEF